MGGCCRVVRNRGASVLDHSCQTKRHSYAERGLDLYETPDVAVEALLRVENLPRRIWEPACGRGAIVNVLRSHGHEVVASDIAGYREVVRNGVDGLLVPPGDTAALIAAVRRVLDDPALAARLREAGRARAETYSWDRVTDQVESIYAEVAAAR